LGRKVRFTNAPIEETIYVHQVPGFERQGTEGKVLLLKKALYGTKQAARAWQLFLTKIFLEKGAKIHLNDPCVYMWRDGEAVLFIGTHVDDIFSLFNPAGKQLRDKILKGLRELMEVDDKGPISFALDMRVQRDPTKGILKLSQRQYIDELMTEYKITSTRNCPAPVDDLKEEPYSSETERKEAEKIPIRALVGRLWWLALTTRPDIFCSVHKCALWQNKPSIRLWNRAVYILEYLNGTRDLGIVFQKPQSFTGKILPEDALQVYCDASFASDVGQRSRVGFFFFFLGGLVSWSSALTTRLMSSSTEAECNALVLSGKENIWQREFLQQLKFFPSLPPTKVYQDNRAALLLSAGAPCHKRSKHFGLEFAIFREYIQRKEMSLFHVRTGVLPADMLTKSLSFLKFIAFRDQILRGAPLQSHFG